MENYRHCVCLASLASVKIEACRYQYVPLHMLLSSVDVVPAVWASVLRIYGLLVLQSV